MREIPGFAGHFPRAKVIFAALIVSFSCLPVSAQGQGIGEEKRDMLARVISETARDYIGVPYRFGEDFSSSGAVDNSHLFCLIYHQAAGRAGLRFRGYSPMKEMLEGAVRIERSEVKGGDLIVLNDGHAAMIYQVEDGDRLHMIYASARRGRVISFNSGNVVFEAYWLRNLRGFFRPTDHMFETSE